MCSFLHVFLGFIVLFTFIRDHAAQINYTPEGSQRQSQSQEKLVFTQTGLDFINQACFGKDLEDFESTSQQRSFIPYQHFQSNESRRRRSQRNVLPMAMQLWAHQQKVGDNMCHLLGVVDRGYSSPYSTQDPGMGGLLLERLGGRQELDIQQVSQPVLYQVSTGWPTCDVQSATAYQKGQREAQGSWKERSCEREFPRTEHPSGDGITLPAGRGLCALGTNGYLAVWAYLSTPCQSLCKSTTSQHKQRKAGIPRKAYPDPTTMPEETKQFIAKTEQETGRMGIKNLHQATKHLGKVKKHLGEVTDQRRAHRSLWMAHLSSGIKLWEKQLEDFRKHQSMLTELAGKARSEITSTSRMTQQLSSATAGSSQPPPQTSQPEAEDLSEDHIDKEEEALRKQLQGVLQNCASSLGLDLDTQKVIEVQEKEALEDDSKPPKRQRSLEPFAPSKQQ